MAYKAFISYSHTEDFALARAIQHALHHLAKPWYSLRTMSVFRDETDLSASPGLWSSIESALAAADYFILMASTPSAHSPWVTKEVEWWLANRSATTLLVVLSEGSLVWNRTTGGFDAAASPSVPPCLLRAFAEEPFFVDLRFATSIQPLTTRNAAFRDAILDLGATLLGRPKSELDSEDLRQYRRTRRVLIAAVAALSVLSASTAFTAYVATRQRDAAIAASLAIQSESLLQAAPELALVLAQKAFELQPSEHVAFALRRALLQNPQRLMHLGAADVPVNTRFAGRGSVFIAASSAAGPMAGRKAGVWDSATGRLLAELPLEIEGVVAPSTSPDGTRLALSVDNNRFAVYDTKDWHPLKVLDGQEPSFTRDGRLIVGLLGISSLRTWDAMTLEVRATADLRGQYELLDVNSDGSFAFVAEQSAPEVSDGIAVSTSSGEPILGIQDHKFLSDAVFQNQGRTLVAINEDERLEVWDMESHRKLRTLPGETGRPEVGARSPSDERLVIGTADGALHSWEPGLKDYRGAMQLHSDSVSGIKFSPDGKTLLSSTADGTATLIDVGRGRPIAAFGGPQDFVWGSDVAADDDHFLMSHMDGTVRVWSRTTWFPTKVLGTVAVMSADGRVLFTFGGSDEARRLIDVKSGKTIATLPASRDTVSSVAVDASMQRLVLATTPGGVQFWDIAGAKLTGAFTKAGAYSTVVALSPDGKFLAAAGPEGSAVWDVATQRSLWNLRDLGVDKSDLLFNTDSTRLYSASRKGMVIELDVKTGESGLVVNAAEDRAFESVALSRDGQHLLLAGGKSAELWDLQSRSRVQSFSGHSDPVSAAALSPDGKFVITGGGYRDSEDPPPEDRNEVILWDAKSGRGLLRYRSGFSKIQKLAFGATSQDIIAVDLQARFYTCGVCIPDAELAQLVKDRAPRELSSEELARFGLDLGLESGLRKFAAKIFTPARSSAAAAALSPKPLPTAASIEADPRPGRKKSVVY